jgi:hypothetical protein
VLTKARPTPRDVAVGPPLRPSASLVTDGIRLARPIGPLLEVFDPTVVSEAEHPKIPILLTNRLSIAALHTDDGVASFHGDRFSTHGEHLALVVEPERLDRVVTDFGLLVGDGR